jgi:hypothetical protein
MKLDLVDKKSAVSLDEFAVTALNAKHPQTTKIPNPLAVHVRVGNDTPITFTKQFVQQMTKFPSGHGIFLNGRPTNHFPKGGRTLFLIRSDYDSFHNT